MVFSKEEKIHDALNDLVLTAGPIAYMIETQISVNGNQMGNFRSDGLIIATPISNSNKIKDEKRKICFTYNNIKLTNT